MEHMTSGHGLVGMSGLVAWVAMSAIMMGPAALPGLSHVRRNSLRWRRRRAVVEYAGGYLAAWTAAGGGVLLLLRWSGVEAALGVLAFALAASAAWQLTPMKWWCLRACHRSVPLPPTGWAAERAAIRFGALNGSACVGSCWVLMTAMVVAPVMQLELMAVTTAAVAAERMGERPRRVMRWTAVALAVAAALFAVEAWVVRTSA